MATTSGFRTTSSRSATKPDFRHRQSGGIPERHDLIILLVGYRSHPDYDPGWTKLV